MRSGTLRHSVIIETSTESRNAYGEAIKTWSTFATIFAQIKPVTGKETYIESSIRAETTHEIKIRYLSGLTNKMRVNFGGRYFNIRQILNWEERNKEMSLLCTEWVS